MNEESGDLLLHLLGTIVYRLEAALREAPEAFGDFDAGSGVKPPREIVRHMTAVIGYALSQFGDPNPKPPRLENLDAEVVRFRARLSALAIRIRAGENPAVAWSQLLQGPVSDTLTHVGQLAMLRRLAGSPITAQNHLLAAIDSAALLAPPEPEAARD